MALKNANACFLSQKSTQKGKVKRTFIRTGHTPGPAFYQPSAPYRMALLCCCANSICKVAITQGAVGVPGDQKIGSSKQTLSTTKPIAKAVLRSGLQKPPSPITE